MSLYYTDMGWFDKNVWVPVYVDNSNYKLSKICEWLSENKIPAILSQGASPVYFSNVEHAIQFKLIFA